MASRFLIGQKLDDDPWLPTAVGASIEVHAQVLGARGERPEAVAYLQSQLKQFAGTSLPERIRKNINLLDMDGKPAPPLDLSVAPVARRQTALSGCAARTSRPALLLGALVQRLQSGGRHRGQPPADVRAARAGGDRTHPALWICRRR
jgi:hypothetical protein